MTGLAHNRIIPLLRPALPVAVGLLAVLAGWLLQPLTAGGAFGLFLLVGVVLVRGRQGRRLALVSLGTGVLAQAALLLSPVPAARVDSPMPFAELGLAGALALLAALAGGPRNFARTPAPEGTSQIDEFRQMRFTLESIGDAVLTTDVDGRVTYLNAAAARLTGWTPDEAAGHPVEDVLHMEEAPGRSGGESSARHILRDPANSRLFHPHRLIARDGSQHLVDERAAPIRLADGTLAGCVLIFRDVSERWNAQRSQDELAAIVQGSEDSILGLAPDGTIRTVNPAGLLLFDRFEDELRFAPLTAVLAPECHDLVRDNLETAQTRGLPPFECVALRKDGSEIELSVRLSPVRDPSGTAYGISCVVRDITDRNRDERRLAAQYAITRILEQAPKLEAAAPELIGEVGRCTRWDVGELWMLGPDQESLVCASQWKRDPSRFAPFRASETPLVLPGGRGLPREVWKSAIPVWVPDFAGNPDFPRAHLAAACGLKAALGFPIRLGDEVVGVFVLFRTRVHKPEEPLLALLRAIAAQVGQFVHRCRLEEQRGRVEHERQRLLDQLQMQIDRMPIAYLLSDKNFTYTRWNPSAEKMFGFREHEVLGKHPFDVIVPPEARPQVADIFERLRQGDMLAHGTCENLTSDGRRIVCTWHNTPLNEPDGRFAGILSMAQDITESLRAEQALRDSEQRYRTIIETAREGIWHIDAQGTTTFVNQHLAAMLGYTVPEMVGRPYQDFLFESDRTAAAAHLDRRRQGQAGRNDVRLLRKNGRELWAIVSSSPLHDDRGQFLGVLAMLTDITERRILEEQLRQAVKMKAVGNLAGGIAHDFNNLLTTIIGCTELLLMELPSGDPKWRHAQEIRKSADRAAGLTRQLLAFSRKQMLAPRILDLNALIHDLEGMLGRLIGENIRLSCRLDPELGRVEVDRSQTEQVILNLVVNARDAMPDGGRLILATRNESVDPEEAHVHKDARPGPHVVLSVTDTGTGISEEVKAHLFEPFFTTKEVGRGTGLGLATVYGIVTQSGGHLRVESTPGEGSTFSVYFPRVEGEVDEPRREDEPRRTPRGHETLLLVEDDSSVRPLFARTLGMEGYQVLQAADGTEALALAAAHSGPIDLLVTDVVMPGMNGRQLAEKLLALRPNARLLFMSGYTAETIDRHGMLQPGTNFLSKPFTPRQLARKVREILDAPVVGNRTTEESELPVAGRPRGESREE